MQLGQYEVIRSLGKGSFGEVFLARTSTSTGFQKTVAIKRLRDAVADDTELIERFAIEARICGHLNHPNIIQVYNFIESPDGFLLVMEHLNGLELRQILSRFRKERRILPAAITVSIIRQLCEGLHFAHVACSEDGKPLGLVHRDIKPSNLMITAQSNLKIMDFGVARADFARTRSGIKSVKGTLQYMAPEQVVGGAIDASVDQYATGLILAEMLIGYPVYHADTENQLFFMVGTGAVEPVLELLREHHPVLHPIVQRALALSPSSRFSGLDEMSKALSEIEQFLPATLSPAAFFTALLDEQLSVAELGAKPSWPLRQREANKERERLNVLARGLGMATPTPADPEDPGSSLTDHGLQLEPVSMHEESSHSPGASSHSLEGTFPTGVMPAELARLADPLAALREASSLHLFDSAAAGNPRTPAPPAEEDSKTEWIEAPTSLTTKAGEGGPVLPGQLSAPAAQTGTIREGTAQVRVQTSAPGVLPAEVSLGYSQAPAASRARLWRVMALTAFLVVLVGGAGLLALRGSGSAEPSRPSSGPSPQDAAVASQPSAPQVGGTATTSVAPPPAEPAGGVSVVPGSAPSDTLSLAPHDPPLSAQPSGLGQDVPAPSTGSTPSSAPPTSSAPLGPAPNGPAPKTPATPSRQATVPADPGKASSLQPLQKPGKPSLTTGPVPAEAKASGSVATDGTAPSSEGAPQASKVILRVLPRGSKLQDADSGAALDCFWGCSLKPGAHTLQVVSPDGQQVLLPLEVPSGKTLQCSFQVGLDARWKCQ